MPCSVFCAMPCSASETVTPAALMSVPLPCSDRVSVPPPPLEHMGAGADLDEIVAAAARRYVVAGDARAVRAAPEPIVAAVAGQHVVEAGAGDVLDADQRVEALRPVFWATPSMLRLTVTPATAPVL